MPHLLRVNYVSRATDAIDPASMEVLMDKARLHNEKVGISGVLCFGRGCFVQALEGPEAGVILLYASIVLDPRNRQSALLSIGLVSARAFAQWAMAVIEGDFLGGDLQAKLVNQVLLVRDIGAFVAEILNDPLLSRGPGLRATLSLRMCDLSVRK